MIPQLAHTHWGREEEAGRNPSFFCLWLHIPPCDDGNIFIGGFILFSVFGFS